MEGEWKKKNDDEEKEEEEERSGKTKREKKTGERKGEKGRKGGESKGDREENVKGLEILYSVDNEIEVVYVVPVVDPFVVISSILSYFLTLTSWSTRLSPAQNDIEGSVNLKAIKEHVLCKEV